VNNPKLGLLDFLRNSLLKKKEKRKKNYVFFEFDLENICKNSRKNFVVRIS